MISLDKIPDALGHLILAEDGVILSSGGELENSEDVANVVYNLLSITDKLGSDEGIFKKISVVFKESSYLICLSNKKIYILKKKFICPALDNEEENSVNA